MKRKKLLALILALAVTFSLLPLAYAEDLTTPSVQEEIQTAEALSVTDTSVDTDEPVADESVGSVSDESCETENSENDKPEQAEDSSIAEGEPSATDDSDLEASPEELASDPSVSEQPEMEMELEPEPKPESETEPEPEPETVAESNDSEPDESAELEDTEEELQPDEEEDSSSLEPLAYSSDSDLLEFIMQNGKNYKDETAYPWASDSAEFRLWLQEQPEAKLTLSQWIKQNHASNWISTTDLTLANHLLLEGILLHKWETASGPHYVPDIAEGMSNKKLAEAVSIIVSYIPDRQYRDSTGSYSFDCIGHAETVVAMLHALNIKGRMRYDASYNYTYASAFAGTLNHHNVLCYPEHDDEPYLIDENGGLDKQELYDYVVLDKEKKTCAVVGFNGLDARHMVIPSQIKGYTVTEVWNTLTFSLYESSGCVEPEIITVPPTVTSISGSAFILGATKKIWAVTGMSGITELKGLWDWTNSSSNVIRVLNFFDESTTSNMVNVIPARFADNNWSSFQESGCDTFIAPYVTAMKFEEGITDLGGEAYDYTTWGTLQDDPRTQIPSAQELYLPESLKTILPGFAGSAIQELRVYIPSGVTSIGQNSFNKNAVFYAEATNTVAKEYAKANGIPFIPVKNVVTGKEHYTRTWDIDIDLSDAQITVNKNSISYTGQALTPDITVSIAGKTLDEIVGKKAYDLHYTNNVNVGTATVTATGKAPCRGRVSARFQITKAKSQLTTDQSSYNIELLEPQKISVHNAFGKLHYSVDYSSYIGFSDSDLKKMMSVSNDGVVTIGFEGTFPLIIRADGDSNHEASSLTVHIHGVHNKPHSYEIAQEEKATCEYPGEKILRCKACGYEKRVSVAALGHDYKDRKVTPANYGHAEEHYVKCTRCGECDYLYVGKPRSRLSLKNATVKLRYKTATFTGKALRPSVTVKLGNQVVPSKYYTVTYNNNLKPGKATVRISARGGGSVPYSGSKQVTFTIAPKKSTISSVKALKGKKMIVKWKKNTSGKGYQVQYSTDKAFKKGVKTVKIGKNKTVKTTIKKLKQGTTYYVRIRTVSGKVSSAWSAAKTVKVTK